MQIDVVTGFPEAAALRPEWDALLAEAADPSVFLTPDWLLAWWAAYGAGLDMHLVVVRDEGRLAGLFPLAFSGRTLHGWSNGYSDRFGPIVAEGCHEAVEAAARHLAGEAHRWSRLNLMPLAATSPITRWLGDALDSVGAGNRSIRWFRSPIVDLPADPTALRASLSGSFRGTLARKEKKAVAAGWTVEIRRDAAALGEVFDVDADTWAHREGTGIGSTGANRRFYEGLAAAAAERGWLRVGLLRDGDGKAVAFELNLRRGDAAVNLKLGYRESAGEMSPGLVLRGRVLDALIEEGVGTFDLLGRDEPYKMHWTGRTVEHVRIRAFPPTPAGRARHLYRHRLRPAVGRVLATVGIGKPGVG